MKVIDVQKLLEKGAYFGHKIARTNPKSLSYTYKAQNGIYIIDLFKTKADAERAINMLYTCGSENKKLLVVASKKIIKDWVQHVCEENNIAYLTEKWIGGFFTNFNEVSKNLKRINQWIQERDNGTWNSMLKHRRVKLEKVLNKMLRVYKGVLTIDTVPDVILLVDANKEQNALTESRKIKEQQTLSGQNALITVGVADTNANPTELDFPIVANDDSAPALEYILDALIGSYVEGKKSAAVREQQKEEKPVTEKPIKTEMIKKTAKRKTTQQPTNERAG